MKKLLLGMGSLLGALAFSGCVATTSPDYGAYGYSNYPAVYATAPAPGTVWIEGDWYLDGGTWRRHPGRWERPPYRGARYNRGYWRGGERHEWHRGEWR
jgi:hypothetical protein